VADDLAGWAALVAQLYAQRARAYATADGTLLTGVYVSGSDLLRRDAEQVAQLSRAGQAVVGFQPTVLRVSAVTVSGDRALLDVVDEVPGHRVVARGSSAPAVAEVAGRGPAPVAMTLRRTGEGWRIADAARSG
jgi:hypothetical protein